MFAGTIQQSSQPYADDPQDRESDREDEIQLFHRVQVKARRGFSWSPTDEYPFLYLTREHSVRLIIDHLMTTSRPITSKAAAVHSRRPFDQRLYYFEIEIMSGGYSDDGDG
ncbi:hypothetical protein N7G274_003874 [Stereocaulon virgatum]|uniref:Uncharacterized protein n=1 Tax=Stereocaulon virgatum TaxID=373712 RepID=A0ABR4ACJ8_9LECA